MAFPAAQTRGTVSGVRIDNGWQSTIAFADNLTIEIYEKTITPPSVGAGDPIDTTTMLNDVYMTKSPQCLEEWGDIVVVAAYDPAVLSELRTLLGDNMAITIEWPDGTKLTVWGFLNNIEYGALVKGEQPEITLTVVVSNYDSTNCVEAGPVLTAGTGSCVMC